MKGKKRKGADGPKQPNPKQPKPKRKDKPDDLGWVGPVSPQGRALKERLKERAKSRIQFVKCYLKGFISSPAASPAANPSGSSPAADPFGSSPAASPAANPSGSSPAADPSGSSPAANPSGSSPAAEDPSDSSQAAEDPSDSSSSNKRTPADIGSGLADERAFLFDPATQMGMGLDPGAIQAVSAASGMWRADGLLQGFYRSKLTRSQVQHDSGLIQARHNTQRWNENIKLELQHLAAATPAGTSLVAIQRQVTVSPATWDAVWGEYLHPKWAEQRMRLHGAQETVLERYFMKVGVPKGRGEGAGPQAEDLPTCDLLGAHVHSPTQDVMRFVCALCAMQLEEEAASVSQQEWGTRKQLMVFFGNASIGTRGGVPGKVVTVDEFRTSRVSSILNSPQPCEEELDRSKPTRLEGWKPKPGQVQDRLLRSAWSKRFEAPVRGLMWCPWLAQATPGKLGKWVDRDCNAALNLQRAGESRWRPLELCRWQHRGRLPAQGKEYPALGFKKLRERAPKAQVQQPVAQWLDRATNPCLNFQRIGESKQRPLELCSWKDLEALPPIGEEYPSALQAAQLALAVAGAVWCCVLWCRCILPIGLLFAITLWTGNAAYLYLSVSFIQMLKASMPMVVYVVGVMFATEKFTLFTGLNMIVVGTGIGIASYGEILFVWVGVILQAASICTESVRLTLVQILLQSRGIKMNPISSLYHIAPCCFVFLALPFTYIELPKMMRDPTLRVNVPLLLVSASGAFALNMAVFLLIGKTSALTMNVAGVVKDWLLILLSVVLYGSPVTTTQLMGYGLAFAGVCVYNYQKIQSMKQQNSKVVDTSDKVEGGQNKANN
ncbi:hypothetical protein QJQ45_026863 [Haematococcus lacustris]|nr:hypothetical protein QJQ45_026863 [Haematococcus lacustris]